MALFNRVVNVEFMGSNQAGLSVDGLRVSFLVTKAITTFGNNARISIYNLSEDSRNSIQSLGQTVRLSAGYSEDVGAKLIFVGEIVKITHTFNDADIITEIIAGDGINTLRERRINVSYIEGVSHRTVLESIAGGLDLTLRALPADIEGEYINGFSYIGSAREALDKVTLRLNMEWSIQNGELQIIRRRAVTQLPPVAVNYTNGLLSAPESQADLRDNLLLDQENPGYILRMLLNPELEPAQRVNIEAGNVTGIFRITSVSHDGDNGGADFLTTLEVAGL